MQVEAEVLYTMALALLVLVVLVVAALEVKPLQERLELPIRGVAAAVVDILVPQTLTAVLEALAS